MSPPTQEPCGPSCDSCRQGPKGPLGSGARLSPTVARAARPLRRSRFPSPPSFQGLRGCALRRGSVASSNHTTAICSQGCRCRRRYRCLLLHLEVEHLQLWGWPSLTSLSLSPAPSPRAVLQDPQLRSKASSRGLALPPQQTMGELGVRSAAALNRQAPEPPGRGAWLSPSPRCPPLHLEPKFFVRGQSISKLFLTSEIRMVV